MEKLYKKTRDLLKKWGVTDEEADEFMKELMDTADKDEDGDVSDDVAEAKEEIAEEGKDEQTDKDRVDKKIVKSPFRKGAKRAVFAEKNYCRGSCLTFLSMTWREASSSKISSSDMPISTIRTMT